MMMKLASILLTIVLLFGGANSRYSGHGWGWGHNFKNPCPTGSTTLERNADSCFRFIDIELTFEQAEEFCEELDGAVGHPPLSDDDLLEKVPLLPGFSNAAGLHLRVESDETQYTNDDGDVIDETVIDFADTLDAASNDRLALLLKEDADFSTGDLFEADQIGDDDIAFFLCEFER